ncbi:MAG: hypothetical protein E7172_04575 [Firmicutes bacterium]|nr:hypothetical protein [Bacillota bacterium]
MIKKIINNIFRCVLIILILITSVTGVIPVKAAANTLSGLKGELATLQKKKNDAETKKKLTQSQIIAQNNAIKEANDEIEKSEQKVIEAKVAIEESNKKISEYENKTEELMAFYQIMTGENSYYEFITDSSSMTELIMRSDAISEIVNYNKEKLDELENLIEENEQLQVEMIKYEKKLNNDIISYENKIDELGVELIQFSDIAITIDDEISLMRQKIKYYEDLGCKPDQDLDTCEMLANNSGWLKPLVKGKVTSLFGYRNVAGQSSNHSGIDLGGVSEGTTVYSVTSGKVVGIINKSDCGGNQVYVQSIVKGQKYTILYAHLLSISVKLGDSITNETIIGKMGGGSTAKRNGGYDRCTTGTHLHLSVSKGHNIQYAKFVANLINPPGFPGKGVWFYSRHQWFG